MLNKAIQLFQQKLGHICSQNVPCKTFSYWKIGGPAALLVEPESINELATAIKLANTFEEVPYLVIGDGSNMLYDSEGFDGILIKIGNKLSRMDIKGTTVICEAGVWVPEITYRCSHYGLTGIEHICGIPGRIGGLIYMNGGASRRSILENTESIDLINKHGEIETVTKDDLIFSYRTSPFQNDPRIIARATFKLSQSTRKAVRSEIRKILASRRSRFPRKLPNCGSVFLSNPNMYETIGPPGLAIEREGLKGTRKGDAQISPQHANFIVNLGNATSDDVLYLIALCRHKVYESTGFKMDCEVRYLSKRGELMQAHQQAENSL
uniref:UDP-N-acetylmuramate dehydrogenase n=1 Tax=Ningiella ruwaisensis TaxID=2364274 RepID=UPI0010A0A7E2|nr:UDP-N-acetylmuramate dehydrogenase [Ningiella ruwaisensis]